MLAAQYQRKIIDQMGGTNAMTDYTAACCLHYHVNAVKSL